MLSIFSGLGLTPLLSFKAEGVSGRSHMLTFANKQLGEIFWEDICT